MVGISDYQDNGIPDLKYAHRDAEAFAEWLRSPGGGRLPDDQIKFFTDAQATLGKLAMALDWLQEQSEAGDLAIIYFSGHGDVEKNMTGQPGFLLCRDAPSRVYYGGGALSLNMLQEVVNTLSVGKKARVILITDACRSGKLAGEAINGTQLTNSNLAQHFINSTKILSCQPNEYSLESTQWGGGRGVFSFYLVDGLYGMADANSDLSVSLLEVMRYLQDKVPAQTAPVSQMPLILGNLTEKMASVDAGELGRIRRMRTESVAFIEKADLRGIVDDLLAAADSATRSAYANFEQAIRENRLLDSTGQCANDYYSQLLKVEQLLPIYSHLRRNLAAALIDDVQQALNALLADDPYETNNFNYNPAKYTEYPRYLHRTIELLGGNHYMYPTLRAKELYFESYILSQSVDVENATAAFQDSVRALAKEKMLAAIAYDPQAAYLYYSIGKLYWWNSPPRTDSLVLWCERAIERAPNWLLPYLDVAYEYNSSQNDPIKSEQWLLKAVAINPNSYNVQERLSWLYQWLNRMDEALALSEKMIRERPELFNAYSTAGVACITRREYMCAEHYFEKSLAIEPGFNNWANLFLTPLYLFTRRQQQAIALVDSIFNSPSVRADIRSTTLDYLRSGLLQNQQYDLAAHFAEKQAKLNVVASHQAGAEATLGIVQILKGNYSEGRAWMQKACKTDSIWVNAWPVLLHQYEAIIAEKEGNGTLADSFFREAFRIGLSNLAVMDSVNFFTEPLIEDYGRFLLRQKRYTEAVEQFQTILTWEPNSWRGYLGMALCHAQKRHKNEALDWLEKSLDHWLPTAELATGEPLFKKIRKTKRFKILMAKHFHETAPLKY